LKQVVKKALSGGLLLETGWFEPRFISTALDQHIRGLRDNSRLIWALLMFEAFLRDVHQEAGAGETAFVSEPVA
jgi:asparagine synthase (glutamine-hydrolysing)